MARTEAPATSESRRQQQLTTPATTAPLLDSTTATIKCLMCNAIDPKENSQPRCSNCQGALCEII